LFDEGAFIKPSQFDALSIFADLHFGSLKLYLPSVPGPLILFWLTGEHKEFSIAFLLQEALQSRSSDATHRSLISL